MVSLLHAYHHVFSFLVSLSLCFSVRLVSKERMSDWYHCYWRLVRYLSKLYRKLPSPETPFRYACYGLTIWNLYRDRIPFSFSRQWYAVAISVLTMILASMIEACASGMLKRLQAWMKITWSYEVEFHCKSMLLWLLKLWLWV